MRKGNILINVNDIIGKRLDKLEVICYVGYHYTTTRGGKRLRHYYACQCECGNIAIIQRGPLKNNLFHSCGCGRRGQRGNKNEKQR